MFWKPREPADESNRILLLNQPRALIVAADERGVPRQIGPADRQRRVARIVDVWRIDDEWWRTEISRHYFVVTLEDGVIRTIFHDLIGDGWYEQYA